MSDFLHRATDALLGSELLPASFRTKLMRMLGYDIHKKCCIWARASFRSKNLKIGSGVFINVGFFYDGNERLTIGNNVRFGQFVRIITATHDIGPPHQRGLIEVLAKPVTVGDGCWVGTGVTIMPGVIIAPGCVLGASALLTRSTEPNGLYAGVPARRIRELALAPTESPPGLAMAC